MWPAINRPPTTVVGTSRAPTRPQRGSRRGVLLQQPCRGRDGGGSGWRCRRAAQCCAVVGGCGSFVRKGGRGAARLPCLAICGAVSCAVLTVGEGGVECREAVRRPQAEQRRVLVLVVVPLRVPGGVPLTMRRQPRRSARRRKQAPNRAATESTDAAAVAR
jgi:hypothetical protein